MKIKYLFMFVDAKTFARGGTNVYMFREDSDSKNRILQNNRKYKFYSMLNS